jgi:hypothetical protein
LNALILVDWHVPLHRQPLDARLALDLFFGNEQARLSDAENAHTRAYR